MRCGKAFDLPLRLSASSLLFLSFFLFLHHPSLAQAQEKTSSGAAMVATDSPPADLQIAPSNQTLGPPYLREVTTPSPPETGLSTPNSGDIDDDEEAPPGGTRCQGYYDVMGQWDPPFNCNAGQFLYCCGTCFYRFCCQFRLQKLDQTSCNNYDTPVWANTGKPINTITEGHTDQDRDRTHMIVYIICGVVACMVLMGIFTKLALEKSRGGGGGQNDLSNTRDYPAVVSDGWSQAMGKHSRDVYSTEVNGMCIPPRLTTEVTPR